MKRHLTSISIFLAAVSATAQTGPFVVHSSDGVSTHDSFWAAYRQLNPTPLPEEVEPLTDQTPVHRPGRILLRPTLDDPDGDGPIEDFIDVDETIEVFPGQTIEGERQSTIRMIKLEGGERTEILNEPIVRFAFPKVSHALGAEEVATARMERHGGALKQLTLMRWRRTTGRGELLNNAYGIDVNGADGCRLVFVSIGTENRVGIGSFTGDTLNHGATYDFDPVEDFYFDFGGMAAPRPQENFNLFSSTYAGVLLDRRDGDRGQSLEWFGLIVSNCAGVGMRVDTGRTGYATTKPSTGQHEIYMPQEINLIQGVNPSGALGLPNGADGLTGQGIVLRGDNWQLDRFIVEYAQAEGVELHGARNVDITGEVRLCGYDGAARAGISIPRNYAGESGSVTNACSDIRITNYRVVGSSGPGIRVDGSHSDSFPTRLHPGLDPLVGAASVG